MRIGIYKDTLANNRGADAAVKNLAAGLLERGHVVALFTKDEFVEKVRGDYDVVLSAGTNEVLDLAKVDGLPPIVLQFHTDPAYPFRHWMRRWRRNRAIKSAMRKCAAIQVLGEGHVAYVKKIAPEVPAFAVGNWSAFGGALPARAERLAGSGAQLAKHAVICPAAINKDKNQKLLADAFRTIAADFPDWEVRFYGKGEPTFGPHPQMKLMGYADLAEPYADCAFVAFPSKTEGFGLAIADAAAFGKPCVMIKDWIGTCAAGGGIVTKPTAKAFAAGLRQLMADERLRQEMGERARAHCAERHSRAKILDQWEALLEKVRASRSGG